MYFFITKLFKRFFLLSICTLTLCLSTTNVSEARMYIFTSPQAEKQAGDSAAAEIEAGGVITGSQANQIVDKISNNLKMTINPRYDYQVKILNTNVINAYSVPGGHIYVTKGIVEKATFVDELAFVIGHEFGHDMNEHYMKTIDDIGKAEVGVAILGSIFKVKQSTMNWTYTFTYIAMRRGYGFAKEHEADRYGFQLLADSGYNVGGGAVFFHKLLIMEQKNQNRSTTLSNEVGNYLSPHPKSDTRLNEQLDFIKDFSKGHVSVSDSKIYIDGKFAFAPIGTQKCDRYERAYLIAGNIARLYHNNPVAFWSVNDSGELSLNGKDVFTPQQGDESAETVLARISSPSFSKK